jgi:hypothetical protein
MIKNARTISRLIWIHVPNSISKTPNDLSAKEREKQVTQVVAEKKVALGLVEGYVLVWLIEMIG